MKLKQIKVNTNWASAAQAINDNSQTIQIEFEKFLYGAKSRGYFIDLSALEEAYPTANKGDVAFVLDHNGGHPLWSIYSWDENGWEYTGYDVPIETEIDLSGNLQVSSLSADNGIFCDNDIETNGRFVVNGKTNDEVLLAGGGTMALSELGKLSTTDTTDTNDYEDVF